ncbi:UrcA family protein [Altererythrobacter sp. MF3-039]|uniref:UrcA family protein n=1 Tax=Altererythrobacter sp. MF3-039 TaxID=3252901 RepID=UPI00390CD322
MTKIPHALAALALAATTSPAFADERAVSYADLNLASPEGQEILERRITRALEEVCQVQTIRTGTRVRSNEARRCMVEARANAKNQVAAILDQKGLGG